MPGPVDNLKRDLSRAEYALYDAEDAIVTAGRTLRSLPRVASIVERDAMRRQRGEVFIEASQEMSEDDKTKLLVWIEKTWRSRTPPRKINEVDPGTRVERGEVRTYAKQQGLTFVDLDEDFARRLLKMFQRLRKEFPDEKWSALNARSRALLGSISASESNATKRMIEAAGMPFPIDENSKTQISARYARGKSSGYEKQVPLSLLVATQRDFDVDKVASMMGQDEDQDPICCVLWRGKYYVDDGHHRAMAAKFGGEKTVNAHVVEAA